MNTDINTDLKLTSAEARAMLTRFEAGETSLAEEAALFDFFSSPALPADLEPLRPLMAWYAGGCVGEPQAPAATKRRSFILRPLLRMAAAVAAIIAVAVTALHLPQDSPTGPADDFATIYAGSYIIRDGRKITDPKLIRDVILSRQARLDSINTLIAAASDPRTCIVRAIEERYASNPLARQAALDIIR